MSTFARKEEDFQLVSNKYAVRSIAGMREELDDEEQRERISSEGALDIEVRGDWHTPGNAEDAKPTEYFILLGTGGPTSRIKGELNKYCEPSTAIFECQDWFKP